MLREFFKNILIFFFSLPQQREDKGISRILRAIRESPLQKFCDAWIETPILQSLRGSSLCTREAEGGGVKRTLYEGGEEVSQGGSFLIYWILRGDSSLPPSAFRQPPPSAEGG